MQSCLFASGRVRYNFLRKAGDRVNQKERSKAERARLSGELIKMLEKMGYPEAFGRAIAADLRTEYALGRMLGYLRQAKPKSAEEIADEMLAIDSDRRRFAAKKKAEWANAKYNAYLEERKEDDP